MVRADHPARRARRRRDVGVTGRVDDAFCLQQAGPDRSRDQDPGHPVAVHPHAKRITPQPRRAAGIL